MASNASDTPTSADLEFMSFSQQQSAPPAHHAPSAAAPPLPPAAPLGRAPVDESFTIFSLLSPAFYTACFDVDVGDVVSRVRAALWPFRPPQPFLSLIAAKPDLYGPVWLAATLVFTIAVGFNMASWLNFRPAASLAPWEYDFKALTKALLFVFGFSFGAPAAVWLGMTYTLPRSVCLGLVTLTCVYGYSIVPFIPAAVRFCCLCELRFALCARVLFVFNPSPISPSTTHARSCFASFPAARCSGLWLQLQL